jgi:hypothetical protein
MANIRVYSRSNVSGNPYLWRPQANIPNKEIPLTDIAEKSAQSGCDGINDYVTTYVSKRIWVAQTGIWLSPLYVQCSYVE